MQQRTFSSISTNSAGRSALASLILNQIKTSGRKYMVINSDDLPEDFRECVRFHGHICPGLAIGYAAVKAGSRLLGLSAAKDEEILALVENDSCAVDAVQSTC